MMRPDGMGADRYNERQNMRAAATQRQPPLFDIVALDSDGEFLYEAESAWTEEAAESELEACRALLASTAPHNIPEEVDDFEIRRRKP